MIRRTTPSPASNTYIVPATITPMLVPERSAVIAGEPTPSTIAVVDAAAFRWDRSQPAEPTTIAPVARGVMRRLSFIEHPPYALHLHFHDLRHEAGSRKLEAGWPLHAVSRWLGHTKLTTTDTYLNATTQLLHELNERKPLALVKS